MRNAAPEKVHNDMPLVSILTTTWNRAPFLERVWKGLENQTYRHIEWVVADDGSSDETSSLVRELAARSDFPVTFIKASVHIGKARMDNEGIGQANGEFILWNDSDDYLLPNAIELLVKLWFSIPEPARNGFVGVTALCANEQGVISAPSNFDGPFDTTWNDLVEILKIRGDMQHLIKTSALKACPFPEVDFVIPESVTWTSLGNRKIRLLPRVVKIVEYGAPNCISHSGKMEYSRGRAYALASSERNLRSYPRTLRTRIWKLITYIRLSIHGEICLHEQKRMWLGNSSASLFYIAWPAAWLVSIKDRLQRKVRKTHRAYLAASELVTMDYYRLGRNAD